MIEYDTDVATGLIQRVRQDGQDREVRGCLGMFGQTNDVLGSPSVEHGRKIGLGIAEHLAYEID